MWIRALVRVKAKFTVKRRCMCESSATTYGEIDCELTLTRMSGVAVEPTRRGDEPLALAVVNQPKTVVRHDDDVARVRVCVEDGRTKDLIPVYGKESVQPPARPV